MEETTTLEKPSQHDTQYLKSVNEEVIAFLDKHAKSGFERSFHEYRSKAGNPATPHKYEGFNEILLNLHASNKGYETNQFMPFKFISATGASVLKGEKAKRVLSTIKKTHFDENGKDVTEEVKELEKAKEPINFEYFTESKPITYCVFNTAQLRNLSDRFKKEEQPKWLSEAEVNEKVENLATCLQLQIVRSKDIKIAHYDESKDTIKLPNRETYTTEADSIRDLLPLIIEATGHKNRLNRDVSKLEESKDYLSEKLASEMAASSLANELGFCMSLTKDEKLLEEWKRVLATDPYFLFNSSRRMTKSLRFIKEKELTRQFDLKDESDEVKERLETLEKTHEKKSNQKPKKTHTKA